MSVSRKLKSAVLAAIAVGWVAAASGTPAVAADKFVVGLRLAKWKTAHFDDADSAKAHYDTLRRLGCEAKQENHNGHIDVAYRSVRWRSISLQSDRDAQQWAEWLEGNGFETLFVQPAHSTGLETVSFRLTSPRHRHLDSQQQAESKAATLRMLGCQVDQHAHGDHYDVSYSCPQWRVVGFKNHDDAHRWEKWLTANGFETAHEHNTAQFRGESSRRR